MALWREAAPDGAAGAAFHAAARDAWLRFSEETAAEGAYLRRRCAYPAAAFDAHAGKVALAEVPLLAVLAHRGAWDLAPHVRPLVHALGRAYGYVNDVVGHARDLRNGGNTHLLATVRSALGDHDAPDEVVQRAIATGPWLDAFLGEAVAAHEASRPLGRQLDLHDFDAWTDARVAALGVLRQRMFALRLRAALDV
jgi:hypothetical protein